MLWRQMPNITRPGEVAEQKASRPLKCGGNAKPSQNLTSYLFPYVEKYFDMKKAQCKEGLDIYKKFLTRMTRISEFLKVAEVRRRNLWYWAPWLCNEPIHMEHALTSSFLLITASGNRPRGHTRPITGEDKNVLALFFCFFEEKPTLTAFPSAYQLLICHSALILQDMAWAPQPNLARLH